MGGIYLHNWVSSAHFLSIWIDNTYETICYLSSLADDIEYIRI